MQFYSTSLVGKRNNTIEGSTPRSAKSVLRNVTPMRNTFSHGSEKKVGDPPTCNAERDIVYRPIDGEPEQDPKLAQLDLYFADLSGGKRVVVYVHGGGWTRGDKSEIHENPRLLEFLLRNECLVASVNFRPIQTNEARKVTYADQANDIAAALKWLSNHTEEFGGRPEGFILLGYSSGAHLSALVALDDRYPSNQGLDGSWVKGVICMDVHSYDIPAALIEMEQSPLKKNISLMTSLFGGSRSEQDAASPIVVLGEPCPEIVPVVLLRPSYSEQSHVQVIQGVVDRAWSQGCPRAFSALRSSIDSFAVRKSPRQSFEKHQGLPGGNQRRAPARSRPPRRNNQPVCGGNCARIRVSLHEFYSWRKHFNRHRSTSDSPASGKGSVRRGSGNIAPRVKNSIEEISEERQREAVRLAETTKRPAVEIAREFGVSLHEFYSWREHFNQHRSTRTGVSYSGGTTQVRSRTDSPA